MVVRIAITVLALAATFLAAPAGARAPDNIAADLSIRIDQNPRSAEARGKVFYVGKLRSEKRACENFRMVTLWKIPEASGVKESIGTSETQGAGKWAVTSFANVDGAYFATTPKVNLQGGKVCKKARSEDIIRDVMP